MEANSKVMAALTAAMVATACTAVADRTDGIQVPAGQVLVATAHAVGDQVYECKADPAGPKWALKAPDARLSVDGRSFGTHYAGPTWEATDGSKVMGKVVASAPSAGTIPHLLLERKDGAGSGTLHRVNYIVRRDTRGGLAPTEGCDAASVSRIARSAYEATYDFYAAEPGRS